MKFLQTSPLHTVTEIQRASGASLTVSPFTLDPPLSLRESGLMSITCHFATPTICYVGSGLLESRSPFSSETLFTSELETRLLRTGRKLNMTVFHLNFINIKNFDDCVFFCASQNVVSYHTQKMSLIYPKAYEVMSEKY